MNMAISDIMKGVIGAIWIGFGYITLWCGIFCLIGLAAGMAVWGRILWCGVGCVVFGVILIASGVIWYYIVKPKTESSR